MNSANDDYNDWIASDDKRLETRLTALVRVCILLASNEPENDLSDKVVECEALDLSANGIRVMSPVELPTGALLQTVAEIDSQRFELMVETKWSRPMPEAGKQAWSAGLLLVDSEDSDSLCWKEAIIEWLAD
ncbi:MAG: hypothetical protein CSB48_11915 [Proteobacteria bacterium]|nr:MAG: hypothetical protein CSB48_11915 [Pseudomonadota bacterium]